MTAAICSAVAAKSGADRRDIIERQRDRQAGEAAGTPALSGWPWVSAPLPAFTSSESTCPW